MLIAVQPSKITFNEMQFISARSEINTFVSGISDEVIDSLFDSVSIEMAEFLGLISDTVAIVSLA